MLYYKFYIVLQMMFFVMAVKVSLKYTFQSCCSLHIDYVDYSSTFMFGKSVLINKLVNFQFHPMFNLSWLFD